MTAQQIIEARAKAFAARLKAAEETQRQAHQEDDMPTYKFDIEGGKFFDGEPSKRPDTDAMIAAPKVRDDRCRTKPTTTPPENVRESMCLNGINRVPVYRVPANQIMERAKTLAVELDAKPIQMRDVDYWGRHRVAVCPLDATSSMQAIAVVCADFD